MIPFQPLCWGLRLSALGLVLPLVALTACGGEGEGTVPGAAAQAPAPTSAADGGAVPPPAAGRMPATPPGPAALDTVAGFTPLPSPQQVVGPLANGRRGDPFAPLPSTQAGSPTASLPEGFQFTGVIDSRGVPQAIVVLGGGSTTVPGSGSSGAGNLTVGAAGQPSTTLCVGPRGLCPGADRRDAQLPPGWSVTRIGLREGVLSMRQGRLPVTCRLVRPSLRPPYQPASVPSVCTPLGVPSARAASVTGGLAGPLGPGGQSPTPAIPTPSAPAAPSPGVGQAPKPGAPPSP